jgi:hypothetical protein
MSNVVSLRTRREYVLPDTPQNQGVVALLKAALARAERGEIQNVFFAFTDGEGNAGGSWDGVPSLLLMAAARMVRRIHNNLDGKGDRE